MVVGTEREREGSWTAAATVNGAPLPLLAAQLGGLFLLAYLSFGVVLPKLWHDRGFPRVVDYVLGVRVDRSAFERIVEAEGGVNRFAAVASLALGITLLGGMALATWVLGPAAEEDTASRLRLSNLMSVALLMAMAFPLLALIFSTALEQDWGLGFYYAKYFFRRSESVEFGRLAAGSLGSGFAMGVLLRLFGHQFVGMYPRFAIKAVPRALWAWFGSWVWFRWVLNPLSIHVMAAHLGLLPRDSSHALQAMTARDVADFAAIASATHTFALAWGMVVGHVVDDVLASLVSDAHTFRWVRAATLTASCGSFGAFLATWFRLATSANLEFVTRYEALAFARTSKGEALASVVMALSYTVWYVLGLALNQIPSVRAACMRVVEFVAPGLRAMGNVRPLTPAQIEEKQLLEERATARSDAVRSKKLRDASMGPALALTLISFLALLGFGDPHLLGPRIGEIQAMGNALWSLVPRKWAELHDTYTRDQLMFMTYPVLLLSEIPLTFFTVLDLLKLKQVDRFRMHYSKLDHRRPRTYPTNEQMWRALKHHVKNLGGVYTPVFLLGVAGACVFDLVPYSLERELPSYWLLDFVVSSLLADQLFYWIHRFLHRKEVYGLLHQTHHEWVYSIALSHHHMDVAEALLFMIPPVLPPVLLRSHLVVVWMQVFFTQLSGILSHSAFCIPFLAQLRLPYLDGRHHDLHHLRRNANYAGISSLPDLMWGTFRYEPLIYVDGIDPTPLSGEVGSPSPSRPSRESAAPSDDDDERAMPDVADDVDPWSQPDVAGDARYVVVDAAAS